MRYFDAINNSNFPRFPESEVVDSKKGQLFLDMFSIIEYYHPDDTIGDASFCKDIYMNEAIHELILKNTNNKTKNRKKCKTYKTTNWSEYNHILDISCMTNIKILETLRKYLYENSKYLDNSTFENSRGITCPVCKKFVVDGSPVYLSNIIDVLYIEGVVESFLKDNTIRDEKLFINDLNLILSFLEEYPNLLSIIFCTKTCYNINISGDPKFYKSYYNTVAPNDVSIFKIKSKLISFIGNRDNGTN